jgi:hypothetical protein
MRKRAMSDSEATFLNAGRTFSPLVAKWPCQKRVIFSTKGEGVLTIRVIHQWVRSLISSLFFSLRAFRAACFSGPSGASLTCFCNSSSLCGSAQPGGGVKSCEASTSESIALLRPSALSFSISPGRPPNPARTSKCAAASKFH